MTGALEPGWCFIPVDLSRPMLDIAVEHVTAADLASRTEVHLGHVEKLLAASVTTWRR